MKDPVLLGGKSKQSSTAIDNPQFDKMHQDHHQPYHHLVAQDFAAGFLSSSVAVTAGFPLDIIKTRLQTSYQTSQREGKSIFKTGRGIIRKEGFQGLYKGLASPLLTLSISGSISFASYGSFRELYRAGDGWDAINFLAGMSCGPIIGVISTVENHIRTQMQIDNVNENRFRNSLHCLRKIVRYHGVPTLFTGWGITTMKDCAYFSTYFFVYEGVKGTLLEKNANSNTTSSPTTSSSLLSSPKAAIPIAGGTAGVSAWLVAYPLDCVRAGLQGQSLNHGQTPTGWQVFQNLLQSRGVKGLFMGVTPTLLRASLVHSIRFSAYESLLWLFRTYGRGSSQQEDHAPTENHNNRNTSSSVFSMLKTEKSR